MKCRAASLPKPAYVVWSLSAIFMSSGARHGEAETYICASYDDGFASAVCPRCVRCDEELGVEEPGHKAEQDVGDTHLRRCDRLMSTMCRRQTLLPAALY